MTILCGDCREILPKVKTETVQLVYLDPPFFTQKRHFLRTRDNSAEYQFSDQWASLEEYLSFMGMVLTECKRSLKEDGSLFLHCDKSASHHLRLLLDELFGADHFQSEIVWSYRRWSNAKKGLLNTHQTIYFYSKSSDFKFKTVYTDYSPTTNIDQILQMRVRNKFGKSVYQRDSNGDVIIGKEKKGVPLSDVWYIPFLNPKARERVGYPTQKPILLLERIIQIATDENDVVLDPFCGSGTTLVAATLLNRSYIGIDLSPEAVALSQKRVLEPVKSESNLLLEGEEGYLEKSEYERLILKAVNAVPVERNQGIDGFLRNYVNGHPVPVRIQKEGEDIESARQKLVKAGKAKNCVLMVLIRTHHCREPLFLFEEDEHILMIDAYQLVIDRWIQLQTETISVPATTE